MSNSEPFSPVPRLALREATSESHIAVDSLFGAFDLTWREGYLGFLRAQSAAFLPIEAALSEGGIERIVPDWHDRKRAHLLTADLADLGHNAAQPLAPPPLTSDPALLGAAYVLEGSRFGGRYLSKELPAQFPSRFLSAASPAGAWQALIEILNEKLRQAENLTIGIVSARSVFECFKKAAQESRG